MTDTLAMEPKTRYQQWFPEDFMFELRSEEAEASRSRWGTLKRAGNIIRVFNRMREAIVSQQDILRKLDHLEQKTVGHDADIQDVFRVLKQLLTPPPVQEEQRMRIGHKPNDN